jgi:pimeloyl-ACP methyl ester carboxylesterase
MSARVPYDEFGLFHENAAEYGLPFDGPPAVRRATVSTADGRQMSALVWGTAPPEMLLVHGGAQNAHTWDTVAMALQRPLIAADLPGHGHSDGPSPNSGSQLAVDGNAADLAALIEGLAGGAPVHVVGMSLGGASSIALLGLYPHLVRSLTLVDITPGVSRERTAAITAFVNGPTSFPDFDAILARTIEHNPTRTVASLRRGILHNALQLDDGSWVWRYRRHGQASPIPGEGIGDGAGSSPTSPPDFAVLWDRLGSSHVPVFLARGLLPQSVVSDDDEAELLRRRPDARVEHFAQAGHSIQGDMPLELASSIASFVSGVDGAAGAAGTAG